MHDATQRRNHAPSIPKSEPSGSRDHTGTGEEDRTARWKSV